MPPKPKGPTPPTHVAIPNEAWNELVLYLNDQPHKFAGRALEILLSAPAGVAVIVPPLSDT